MPTYRSINISLASQFDLHPLPEYFPPPPLTSPSPSSSAYDLPPQHQHPPLHVEATSTVSCYVPFFPGSQFWICYEITNVADMEEFAGQGWFYFKLRVDGEEIVSWGTGRKEGWRGKVVFSLWKGASGRGVEKRALYFGTESEGNGVVTGSGGVLKGKLKKVVGLDGAMQSREEVERERLEKRCVEIRVYRAKARRRVARELEAYKGSEHGKLRENGVEFKPIGRSHGAQPKRYYQYALSDPVDKPYATFRYYYRTWAELESYGVLNPADADEATDTSTDAPSPERSSAHYPSDELPSDYIDDEDDIDSNPAFTYDEASNSWLLSDDDDPTRKRLSIPPSQKLHPTRTSSVMVSASPSKPYQTSPIVPGKLLVPEDDGFLRTSPGLEPPGRAIDSPTPGQKRGSVGMSSRLSRETSDE